MTPARGDSTGSDRLFASVHVLLALPPLFWAANWIVGRALRDSPPFTLAFARWAFAVAFMLPFCRVEVRAAWPAMRRHWLWLLPVTILGGGIGNVLSYVGLKQTTAINAAFLNSFVPIIIIVLTWALGRERLTLSQVLGVLVSLAGVMTILSRGSVDMLIALRLNRGDLVLLISLLLWSIYTILLRDRPLQLHPMALLFVIAVQALIVLAPFAAYEYASGNRIALTVANIAAVAFIGLFSSFLAYFLYNRGVELGGARLAGLYTHLMPVYLVALAWLFLDENLEWFHVGGIGLIVAGIWLASRGSQIAKTADPDAPRESPG